MSKRRQSKYCHTCGRKLEKRSRYIVHYDKQTGSPVYETEYSCPNRNWISWLMLEYHDSTYIRDDGEEVGYVQL